MSSQLLRLWVSIFRRVRKGDPVKNRLLFFLIILSVFSLIGCKSRSENTYQKYINFDLLPEHEFIEDCQVSNRYPEYRSARLFCLRVIDPIFDEFDEKTFLEQGLNQENKMEVLLESTGWTKTLATEIFRRKFEENLTKELFIKPELPNFIAYYERSFFDKCEVKVIEHDLVSSSLFSKPRPYKEQAVKTREGTYDFKVTKYGYHIFSIETSEGC